MRRLILAVSLAYVMSIGSSAASAAAVSARRALDVTVPDLKFDNISLVDAFNFLRDASGVNLHVNWMAIEAAGIDKATNINVKLRSVTLRKILALVLAEAGHGNMLSYYIDDNVIEVTTREIADRQMLTRVYPVGDLIVEVPDFNQPPNFMIQATQSGRGGGGGGQNLFQGNQQQAGAGTNTRNTLAEVLIETIQAIVQPEIWNTNGGPAAIRFWNSSLIVTAPRSVHEALGGYIE